MRLTISARTLSASDLLPTRRSIIALTSRPTINGEGGHMLRPIQGGAKPGRKVTISNTRCVAIRVTA